MSYANEKKSRSTIYGLSALTKECLGLSKLKEGERNNRLFEASARIGELIGASKLDESDAQDSLLNACKANDLVKDDGSSSVIATIQNGFDKGKQNPREVEDLKHSKLLSTTEELPKHLRDKGLKFDCTQLGNAERFIDQHGHEIRYIPELKSWVVWDGTKWSLNASSWIHERVKKTVKSIYNEARDCDNNEGQRELTRWAYNSQTNNNIDSILKLASKDTKICKSIKAFDTDLKKINCLNGIVDLETGELIGHTQDQLVIQQTNVKYNPNAQCPKWNKFLHEIFLNDKELIQYVQKILGYAITGLTDEQCLFLAYGTGANGKSTLFETILEIIGSYGTTSEFSTFLNTGQSNVRTQEAVGKLKDKRYAIASETESNLGFSEALIKKVTGGDTLIGAKMYGESYEFSPTHTLFLQVNCQ